MRLKTALEAMKRRETALGSVIAENREITKTVRLMAKGRGRASLIQTAIDRTNFFRHKQEELRLAIAFFQDHMSERSYERSDVNALPRVPGGIR